MSGSHPSQSVSSENAASSGSNGLPGGAAWPDLNAAQREAVTASLDPQLVVAGPGTGKTRVLVCRAAYLLTKHEDRFRPPETAVITFTRKAARQLTARLAEIVGPRAQHVRAGTIHRFCATVLTEHGNAVGVPEDFIVISEAVTDRFWQEWFEANTSWCKDQDMYNVRAVKTRVSQVKLGVEVPLDRLRTAIDRYHAMLEERAALDFDDLLLKAREAVRVPNVRQTLRRDTSALLVDEFQDTDPVQFDILKALTAADADAVRAGDGAHLYCVADDDQSIYRFRGARPENLHDLIERFGCTSETGTRHVLGTNYRSNRAIYAVAESVLNDGDQRLKQRGDIRTHNEDTPPVRIDAYDDEPAELDAILGHVRRWLDDDVPRREIAVLASANRRVQEMEKRFLREGIACEASSTDPIVSTPAVKQILAGFGFVERVLATRSVPDGPLEDLLRVALPEEASAGVIDYAGRSGSSLWGTFQTLARDADAARSAGLAAAQRQMERVYAVIGNVLQHARTAEATVGSLAREMLGQLGGATQLLGGLATELPDPLEDAGVRAAADRLRAWRRDPDRRLLLHDRSTGRVQLWRELVRRALTLADAPGSVPNRSPAVFAASDDDRPAPLGPGDLVLTADVEAFLRWADRNGALQSGNPSDETGPSEDAAPHVLCLGPPQVAAETLHLAGLAPSHVTVVAPEGSASASIRLFRLLQACAGPAEPEPLFPEYVMVDLETTSLDVKQCRIAEIGAVRIRNGEEVGALDVQVELPDDLTAEEADTLRDVCGLDPDSDFADAVPLVQAWEKFCDFSAGCPLVAHNGRGFDFRIVQRLDKEHREVKARWTTTYDTLPAAVDLCPDLQQHSAEALRRELLGEDRETAHRALPDCRDQDRILQALQARRASRARRTALEPLLPLALAGATDEARQAEQPPPWTPVDRTLIQVAYHWALRGASPADAAIRRILPRALPSLVRSTPAVYDLVDEDAILERESDRRPGLSNRLSALLAPYRDEPVAELASVLSHLALWGHEDTDRKHDVVTLSTYHSAKGLEFACVVCSGVHDSAFPHFGDKHDPEAQRESRRVLYVGLTRAERSLVVTYPTETHGYKKRRTPFLKNARRLGNLVEFRP